MLFYDPIFAFESLLMNLSFLESVPCGKSSFNINVQKKIALGC